MKTKSEPTVMVKFQFEIDEEEWTDWKQTVTRTKSLDDRIRELIRADTEGRVKPPTEPSEESTVGTPEEVGVDDTARQEPSEPSEISEQQREELRDALAGSGDLLERRVDEIVKMYDHLREHGSAEKDDLLDVVDVGETGYQGETSVWANMVKGKDTLQSLPGVRKPSTGRSKWTYKPNENHE